MVTLLWRIWMYGSQMRSARRWDIYQVAVQDAATIVSGRARHVYAKANAVNNGNSDHDISTLRVCGHFKSILRLVLPHTDQGISSNEESILPKKKLAAGQITCASTTPLRKSRWSGSLPDKFEKKNPPQMNFWALLSLLHVVWQSSNIVGIECCIDLVVPAKQLLLDV